MSARGEAAEAFVEAVTRIGVAGAGEIVFGLLDAPPAGDEREAWAAVGDWYRRALDDAGRRAVAFLVREAAVAATGGVLVQLDGAAGHVEVGGAPFDVEVGLRRAAGHELPTDYVRLVPTESGEDLHDLFLSLVRAGSDTKRHDGGEAS